MKPCTALTTLLVTSFAFATAAFAQSADSAGKYSYSKLSLSFLSNSVYYGRTDSAVVPYITPAFRYIHKSGFFAEASVSYLAKSNESRIDLGYIGAGYSFYNHDTTISGEVYANKYFTNSSSFAVKSALKADAGVSVTYNADILSMGVEVYGIVSKKTDLVVSPQVFRDFVLDDESKWSLSPSFILNAGTSNFYEAYYTLKKFSAKRKKRIANGEPVITPIVQKQNFGILDYELTLPLEYETTKFGFYLTPTYTIPVHPVSFSINNGVTYFTEKLTNTFYAEMGVYVKL